MRLSSLIVAATLPATFAAAAQPRVVAQSKSMKIEDAPGSMASAPVLVNSTDLPTQNPIQLTTVAADKPPWEASIMGLIVFSVAGLYLL
ncbi:hypothetical protein F4677DRAFT_119244 [Hypoxylon crocopeplum]|nr:hypothetical protein F4677DRAFT_119244 [Hypoxylon crocopeplum]